MTQTPLSLRYYNYIKDKGWVSEKFLIRMAMSKVYSYDVAKSGLNKMLQNNKADVGTMWLSENKETKTGIMLRGAYVQRYNLTDEEMESRRKVIAAFDTL